MQNIMLDLETMGNGPDAAIVAINACYFLLFMLTWPIMMLIFFLSKEKK